MARRTRRRRSMIAATTTTMLVGASALVSAQPAPSPTTPSVAGPSVAPHDLAARALARDAVYHADYARDTLYTWTTADQIAELANTKQLLSRTESPERGGAYVEQVLYALAHHGDAIAQLLDTSSYAKMRFAWPAPWATRLGWDGKGYGDALVRVTLKPDAIIVAVYSEWGIYDAHDVGGRPIPLADLEAYASRIAAIYFVSDAEAAPAPDVPPAQATFREYVLCNESMIASWSVGTAEIATVLDDNARMIDAVATERSAQPAGGPIDAPRTWTQAGAPPTILEDAFAAALAFENDQYTLDVNRLTALAKLLRATPKLRKLTGGGTAKFPGLGTPRRAPRIAAPTRPHYDPTMAAERPRPPR